ncbi:ferredoxin [Streptomyces olivaceoviridis]|uniref:ferredoxin n=1 Tax=Streptomyces olivaceoviridis TaxID=1921 RepID=UPI001674F0AB|nr:ferredoxin [Streptomyces olivaceoviridis]
MRITVRITADRSRCVGSGNCVRTAPGVFDQADDGLVRLVGGTLSGEDARNAAEAASLCPAAAIFLTPQED